MSSKEKACLNCKIIYEGDKCPICKENNYTESFKGVINVLNQEKSFIAKKMKINSKGKFAIKTK